MTFNVDKCKTMHFAYNNRITRYTMGNKNLQAVEKEKIMVNLHKTYVIPHLGIAIVAWSPHVVEDISHLEQAQHRLTRMIPTVNDIPYEQRLNRHRLTTLFRRRESFDIIETYTIILGHTQLNSKDLFQFTAETPMQLIVKCVSLEDIAGK